jgi:starch phosphorylase
MKSLGPKVLADRMVRDYVTRLYSPAAVSSRTLNDDYSGAQELADWKKRLRDGWSSVSIDHVESSGVTDAPEIGETLEVRAFVSLGSLTPDDVDVQVVHGRIRHEDDLADTTVQSLELGETYEAGRHRFEGHVPLATTGPFGYTVRVLPKNEHLASLAELGRVTLPQS